MATTAASTAPDHTGQCTARDPRTRQELCASTERIGCPARTRAGEVPPQNDERHSEVLQALHGSPRLCRYRVERGGPSHRRSQSLWQPLLLLRSPGVRTTPSPCSANNAGHPGRRAQPASTQHQTERVSELTGVALVVMPLVGRANHILAAGWARRPPRLWSVWRSSPAGPAVGGSTPRSGWRSPPSRLAGHPLLTRQGLLLLKGREGRTRFADSVSGCASVNRSVIVASSVL
ncbi:Uncharacterised protein [Mycobacterium xenopi]|uniref:Uncharacterized protein n=1 Tax=Mycobacterium xenopi TaxID=1789 RepID=A0AAD1H097_MYCXE|nr:hypothetical protein MYXE_22720 [Mycobacterium xenopi]SPX78358.1 Uncharacterised protein [Mycobacterium xenopi]